MFKRVICGLCASFAAGLMAIAQDQLPSVELDRSTPEYKAQREKERAEFIQQTQSSNSSSPDYVLPIIELWVKDESAFESIQLSSQQKTAIQKLLEERDRKVTRIKEKYAHVTDVTEKTKLIDQEVRTLNHGCNTVIANQLLDMQLIALSDIRPEMIGLAKTLSDTPVGKSLGLTDKQRERIRKDANALGERMFADFEKYKDEAREIILRDLDADQRERLFKAFGSRRHLKSLDDWIMNSNACSLAHELDYRENEFDRSKQRFTANGKVYDGYGDEIKEEPKNPDPFDKPRR